MRRMSVEVVFSSHARNNHLSNIDNLEEIFVNIRGPKEHSLILYEKFKNLMKLENYES